jgi:23S rRNA (cytosine1962-C5)-methyltransferase
LTFSNSKKTQNDLDINRDWPKFVELCLNSLNPDGILYFSTNSKKLRFDQSLLPQNISVKDITEATIPEDFKNKKIHKCWEIKNIL